MSDTEERPQTWIEAWQAAEQEKAVEWARRFGAHPLERQAYFLTGYLGTAPDQVRQDLRDLIRAAGVDMPKTVAPKDADPNARLVAEGPEPRLADALVICFGAFLLGIAIATLLVFVL